MAASRQIYTRTFLTGARVERSVKGIYPWHREIVKLNQDTEGYLQRRRSHREELNFEHVQHTDGWHGPGSQIVISQSAAGYLAMQQIGFDGVCESRDYQLRIGSYEAWVEAYANELSGLVLTRLVSDTPFEADDLPDCDFLGEDITSDERLRPRALVGQTLDTLMPYLASCGYGEVYLKNPGE